MLSDISEPQYTTDVWFKKKNCFYFSFEDHAGSKYIMFASDQETIEAWIKDIKSAIKYYKWI